MTTIAYDHKNQEIAVDSRVSSGSTILSDNSDKIIKNDYGTWFMCGANADYEEYSNLTHNQIVDNVANIPDCGALVIINGVCHGTYIEDTGYFKIIKENHNVTLGSGKNYAMAALDLGRSAKEAVELAAKRDAFTGGEIRSFRMIDFK